MIEHGKIHFREKPNHCKICNKKFKNCQKYKQHLESHSKSKRHFECKTCTKKFQQFQTLKDHELVHLNDLREEKFNCNYCKKCFKNGSELYQHKKQVHFTFESILDEISEERKQNFSNVEYL